MPSYKEKLRKAEEEAMVNPIESAKPVTGIVCTFGNQPAVAGETSANIILSNDRRPELSGAADP